MNQLPFLSQNAELKHVSANEFTKAVAEVREKFV